MANQEEAIRRALQSGDELKVQKAHKEYVDSMQRAGQTAKPLDDFRR